MKQPSLETLKEAYNVFNTIMDEYGEDGLDSLEDVLKFFRGGNMYEDYRRVFVNVELPADSKLDVYAISDDIADLAGRYDGEDVGGGSCLWGNPNRDIDLEFSSDEKGRAFIKRLNATFGRRKTMTITAGPGTIGSLEDM